MGPNSLTTTLTILLTSLTLTTTASINSTASTNSTASNSSASNSTSASTSASASASASDVSSFASLSLPGGTANPALTLFMYDDPACSSDDLVNVLPLSYNQASPQYPFWAVMMTRDLAENETLTFYSSSNTSADACAEMVGEVTGGDVGDSGDGTTGAGVCLPVEGATCFNLTQGQI